MLFRSQWKLSLLASRLALAAGDTKTAAALTVRGKIYTELVGAMRNVSGRQGEGLYAVAYGAVSTDQVARATAMTGDQAVRLVDVLDVLDARIARATRKGMSTGSYLVATGEVALVRGGPGGVRTRQTAFRVITPRTTPELYRLLSALEPQRRPTPSEHDAITQRDDFAALLGRSPKDSLVRSSDRAAQRAANRPSRRSPSGCVGCG
ncbi:hypothetical protein FB00_13545 [Cellulosimicrobium funkei]|uniref:Uncharacterized protein n=1 Tax=Cellulosimicrobium funkei TaxID=264251 RepID=A0A0H2KL54_9MICO|nr:hypothetical protein [Cellulosimicrobium funkei]KLN34196.1 hypothetical protein FB00_13545 [Cellulosimicrobium funkei]